jgi:ribosomal protein S5
MLPLSVYTASAHLGVGLIAGAITKTVLLIVGILITIAWRKKGSPRQLSQSKECGRMT